jgi:phosphatidylserine/phosphatidylglycerophosphate/cardiolipin synthase-like enzyme
MVVWQPALHTPDTIPDPAPDKIPGVNEGPAGSIQARWDKAPGFKGRYTSLLNLFRPKHINFSAEFGCHHQKTYIMDDGADGYVAFVGGINPVQTYWDTPDHDVLDVRRVEWQYPYPLKWLEKNPPLHDIFYRIKGPVVGDVLANFVERYNNASIPYANVTSYVVAPVTTDQIQPVPNGIEVQALRTIAPNTYPGVPKGDKGIRELYLNALGSAGQGSLVYIENQYFFDHGVISEIYEAAERDAKIIALLTSNPDEGNFQGRAEKEWERISYLWNQSKMVEGHRNVALLTLGNRRKDPRNQGKFIYNETYIH